MGLPAQAVEQHHQGAQKGAEEDAGDEGEGSNDEEGNVVLEGQRGVLALPEGLVPKGHDRVLVQLLWDSAEEQTLLWKRKTVLERTLGSWERPRTGGDGRSAGDRWHQGTRTGARGTNITHSDQEWEGEQ